MRILREFFKTLLRNNSDLDRAQDVQQLEVMGL